MTVSAINFMSSFGAMTNHLSPVKFVYGYEKGHFLAKRQPSKFLAMAKVWTLPETTISPS